MQTEAGSGRVPISSLTNAGDAAATSRRAPDQGAAVGGNGSDKGSEGDKGSVP